MVNKISYNLPGYGFANCYLIGQANDVMNMFDVTGIIAKMKNTCQLGTMKYVYPGAHHTRYEYVFTQLMLISNIATSDIRRNVELSLSSSLAEYEALNYKLSGSALLQCLAILSNAGHMYDTFTSSRILLRLLNESRVQKSGFYTVYRRNLPLFIRKKFDEYLVEGNYYKLHLFHIVQILQGLSRSTKYKKVCDLCIYIVSQLIDPKLIKNEATQRIFLLYKKIRKIAYLSVDMVYTPASFGASLNRMIYSSPSYVDDLFDENSAMNKSIQQLEDIIHEQIYNSSMCILNTTRIEQENYEKYKSYTDKIDNIFQLRNLLLEKDLYSYIHTQIQPKAICNMNKETTLLLSKEINIKEKYDLSSEAGETEKLPLTRIAHGTQLAQNLKRIYSAYGLVVEVSIQKDVQTIISNALTRGIYDNSCKLEIVKYAVKSLYKYGDYFFNITTPRGVAAHDCVFIGNGCKKMAMEIRRRFTKNKDMSSDQLHEVLSCATILESWNYTGTIICYVGGIKASRYAKTDKVDELDGFIYLPNKPLSKGFAYIVEAKNYFGGENDAAKQLEETCKYFSTGLTTEIKKLEKCAYIKISKE